MGSALDEINRRLEEYNDPSTMKQRISRDAANDYYSQVEDSANQAAGASDTNSQGLLGSLENYLTSKTDNTDDNAPEQSWRYPKAFYNGLVAQGARGLLGALSLISDRRDRLADETLPAELKSLSPSYKPSTGEGDALRNYANTAQWLKDYNVQGNSALDQFGLDLTSGAGQFARQIATAAVGGPVAGTLGMFGDIAGNQYVDAVNSGVDKSVADKAATGNYFAQAPFEYVGLSKVVSKMPGSPVAKKYLERLLTEGVTEGIQEFPEQFSRLYQEHPNATADEILNMWLGNKDQNLKDAGYSAVLGGILGVMGGSASDLINKVAERNNNNTNNDNAGDTNYTDNDEAQADFGKTIDTDAIPDDSADTPAVDIKSAAEQVGGSEGTTWNRNGDDVDVEDTQDVTKAGLSDISSAYYKMFGIPLTVTSGTGGGSLHASGEHSHGAGVKLDVSGGVLDDKEKRDQFKEYLQSKGVVVLDEYEHPSANSTGGHLDLDFTDYNGSGKMPGNEETVEYNDDDVKKFLEDNQYTYDDPNLNNGIDEALASKDPKKMRNIFDQLPDKENISKDTAKNENVEGNSPDKLNSDGETSEIKPPAVNAPKRADSVTKANAVNNLSKTSKKPSKNEIQGVKNNAALIKIAKSASEGNKSSISLMDKLRPEIKTELLKVVGGNNNGKNYNENTQNTLQTGEHKNQNAKPEKVVTAESKNGNQETVADTRIPESAKGQENLAPTGKTANGKQEVTATKLSDENGEYKVVAKGIDHDNFVNGKDINKDGAYDQGLSRRSTRNGLISGDEAKQLAIKQSIDSGKNIINGMTDGDVLVADDDNLYTLCDGNLMCINKNGEFNNDHLFSEAREKLSTGDYITLGATGKVIRYSTGPLSADRLVKQSETQKQKRLNRKNRKKGTTANNAAPAVSKNNSNTDSTTTTPKNKPAKENRFDAKRGEATLDRLIGKKEKPAKKSKATKGTKFPAAMNGTTQEKLDKMKNMSAKDAIDFAFYQGGIINGDAIKNASTEELEAINAATFGASDKAKKNITKETNKATETKQANPTDEVLPKKFINVVDESELDDAVAKAKSLLNGRLSANPFFDPELMQTVTKIGLIYAQKGVNSFANWSEKMATALGNKVRPYLKAVWNTIKSYPAGVKFDDKIMTATMEFVGGRIDNGMSLEDIKEDFTNSYGSEYLPYVNAAYEGIKDYPTEKDMQAETTDEKPDETEKPAETTEAPKAETKKEVLKNKYLEAETYEHTKTHELFPAVNIVVPKLERSAFEMLKPCAKRNNGYFNRYAKRFLFKNEADRNKFFNEASGILGVNKEANNERDVAGTRNSKPETTNETGGGMVENAAGSTHENDKKGNGGTVQPSGNTIIDKERKATPRTAESGNTSRLGGTMAGNNSTRMPNNAESKRTNANGGKHLGDISGQNGRSEQVKGNGRGSAISNGAGEQRNENSLSNSRGGTGAGRRTELLNGKDYKILSNGNFHMINESALDGGKPEERFNNNVNAIELLRQLDNNEIELTPEVKSQLALFSGWGSFRNQLFKGTWDKPVYTDGWEEKNKQLRELLGKEDWVSAQDSTTTAYFTPPTVIDTVWKLAKQFGFNGGYVLEPSMGVGTFYAVMPEELQKNSVLTGVENDKVSGKIASLLYPETKDTHVFVQGYEKHYASDNTYDLVVGNVPFGNYSLAESKYNKKFSRPPKIHDFFLVKGISQLKPGGIMMTVTSSHSMDKISTEVRTYLAEQAELVGAIRLPNNTFKNSAGTQALTDLLIFKKRQTPISSIEASKEKWVSSNIIKINDKNTTSKNRYFISHPEMIAGNDKGYRQAGQYGYTEVVEEDGNLADKLDAISKELPKDIMHKQTGKVKGYTRANTNEKNYTIYLNDKDQLVYRDGMKEVDPETIKSFRFTKNEKPATAEKHKAIIKSLVKLNESYTKLLNAEMSGAANTEAIRKHTLNMFLAHNKKFGNFVKYKIEEDPDTHTKIYTPKFTKELKYLEQIGDVNKLMNLSSLDKNGKPADILLGPVLAKKVVIENPTINEALFSQLMDGATSVDIDKVAKDSKTDKTKVLEKLYKDNAIFKTPTGEYQPAHVYLAGNVVDKAEEAKAALDSGDKDMERNIKALEKARPDRISCVSITSNIGCSWVPTEKYEEFFNDLLHPYAIAYVDNNGGVYKVTLSKTISRAMLDEKYGATPNYSVDKIFSAAMNKRDITVKRDPKSLKAGDNPIDEGATNKIQQVISQLNEDFNNWLWRTDDNRKNEMEQLYNDTMNAFVVPDYDASFIKWSGGLIDKMDGKPFAPRQHQGNFVYEGLLNERGIAAHDPGTGKTLIMAMLCMELRRTGKSKKPIIFAHNANSAAIAKDFKTFYPNAKILYIPALGVGKNLDTTMRLIGQISSCDWDAIIMPHSLIGRLTFSEDTLMALKHDELEEAKQNVLDTAEQDEKNDEVLDDDDFELTPDWKERIKKQKEAKANHKKDPYNHESARGKKFGKTTMQALDNYLKLLMDIKAMAERDGTPGTISFETSGIDTILVDEAHDFKKGPKYSVKNIKGLDTSTSDKGIYLSCVTDYLNSTRGNKGVFLFSGTIITNTIPELYTHMKYVMPDVLKTAGIYNLDSFINSYAEAQTDMEPSIAGDFVNVKRLKKFVNLVELRNIARQTMDIVTTKGLPGFEPRSINGHKLGDKDLTAKEKDYLLNGMSDDPKGLPYVKYINTVVPMTKRSRLILDTFQKVAKMVRNASGKDRKAAKLRGTILRLQTLAPSIGQSIKALKYNIADLHKSKASLCCENVMKVYNSSDKAVQAIFVETNKNDSHNRTHAVVDTSSKMPKILRKLVYKIKGYNIEDDIIDRLKHQYGVPKNKIAVITSSTSAKERQHIEDLANKGEIRIIIGSKDTLGIGVNIQTYLRAVHHIDALWMPGDLKQEDDRANRQGNKWNTVLNFRYIAQGTDGKQWSALAQKSSFIKVFFDVNSKLRTLDSDAMGEDNATDSIFNSLSDAVGDVRILKKEQLEQKLKKVSESETYFQAEKAKAKKDIGKYQEEIDDYKRFLESDKKDYKKYLENKDKPFHVKIRDLKPGKNGEWLEFKGKDGRKEADAYLENNAHLAIGSPYEHDYMEYMGFSIGLERRDEYGLFKDNFSINRDGGFSYTAGKNLTSIKSCLSRLRFSSWETEVTTAGQMLKLAKERSIADSPYTEPMKNLQKAINDLKVDMTNNPIPAPEWFMLKAPIKTMVQYNGKDYIVTGYSTADDTYSLIVEDSETGEDDIKIPAADVTVDDFPVYTPEEMALDPKNDVYDDEDVSDTNSMQEVATALHNLFAEEPDYSPDEIMSKSVSEYTENQPTEYSVRELNDFYAQAGYHGSPWLFDSFDFSHMGEGEGCQAHGWGGYISKPIETAKNYKDNLSGGTTMFYNGKQFPPDSVIGKIIQADNQPGGLVPAGVLIDELMALRKNSRSAKQVKDTLLAKADNMSKALEETQAQYDNILEMLKKAGDITEDDILDKIKDYKRDVRVYVKSTIDYSKDELVLEYNQKHHYKNPVYSDDPMFANIDKANLIDNIEKIKQSVEVKQEQSTINAYKELAKLDFDKVTFGKNRGYLYKVDIPEDDVLLNEQQMLKDQPPKVKEALEKLFSDYSFDEKYLGRLKKFNTGRTIYNQITKYLGGSAKRASLLLNKYGIKGIKYNGKQDGECFVIFDDKAIKIMQRYEALMKKHAAEIKRSMGELRSEIKDAFPKCRITDAGSNNLKVDVGGGVQIVVDLKNQIVLNAKDEAKARNDHGLLDKNKQVAIEGYYRPVLDKQAVLALSQDSKKGTAYHEAFHAAWDIALTDKEKAAMLKYYKPLADKAGRNVYEDMANASRDWKLKRANASRFGKLFQKIFDFAKKVQAILTGTDNVHNVLAKIESGEVWNRNSEQVAGQPAVQFSAKQNKTVNVAMDKKTGKYIGRKIVNGLPKLFLTNNADEAEQGPKKVKRILASKNWARKHDVSLAPSTVDVTKGNKETYAEKTEREAKEAGYSSYKEEQADTANKEQEKADNLKEQIKNSIVKDYTDGTENYAHSVNDIVYDRKALLNHIEKMATDLGAKVTHKSTGDSNSVYLKMNDVELRLSDHLLPDTKNREARTFENGNRWDNELVINNDAMDNIFTNIKDEAGLKRFVKGLFDSKGTNFNDDVGLRQYSARPEDNPISKVDDVKSSIDEAKANLGKKISTLTTSKKKGSITVDNKKANTKNFSIDDSLRVSPSYNAENFPELRGFFKLGDKAQLQQEHLRSFYYKNMDKNVYHYLKNKGDRENWQEILWQGDAQGKDFTGDELRAAGYSENVIKAYRNTRRLIRQTYTLLNDARKKVNTHQARMNSDTLNDLRDNKFATISKVTVLDNGARKPTYIVVWKQPKTWLNSYNVTPDRMAEMMKEAKSTDANFQILSTAKNKDGSFTVQTRECMGNIANRGGYIPHLFHEFFIMKKDGDAKVVIGTARNLNEAYKKSEAYMKDGHESEDIVIAPKTFSFNNDEYTKAAVVGDTTYTAIMDKLQEDLTMTPEEAKEFANGTIRVKGRNRFFGNFLNRKGAKGYEKDMGWVLNHYFNSASRYVALEGFKPRAIGLFERYFGRFDDDYSNKPLAKYIKDYINDINGNPSVIETMLNNWLNSSKWFQKHFTSNFGDRAALQFAGNITGKVGVMKLGFFNISSAMLNLAQLMNTVGLLGEYTPVLAGMKHALHPSHEDLRVFKDTGIADNITMDSAGGYTQNRISSLGNKSMYLFRKADTYARKAAVLAAYRHGRAKGMSYGDAIEYAKDVNRKSNFDYSVADAPGILRRGSVFSQIAFQFMKYPMKEIELMGYLLKHGSLKQNAKFWGTYLLLSGLFQLPATDWLDEMFQNLFGWSPKLKGKKLIMDAVGNDPMGQALAKIAIYGLGAAAGVDVSGRVGIGDVALGSKSTLYGAAFGATGSTVVNGAKALADLITDNGTTLDLVKQLSPALANYMQVAQGATVDRRGRKKENLDTPYKQITKAIGLRSVDESMEYDKTSLDRQEQSIRTKKRQKLVDSLLRKESTGEKFSDGDMNKMKELGVTMKMIAAERKKKSMTSTERDAQKGKSSNQHLNIWNY